MGPPLHDGPVAVGVDHVDVGRPLCRSVGDDPGALVDQGVEARSTISRSSNVRCGMPAALAVDLIRSTTSGPGGFALLVIAVPAATRLLSVPPELAQLVGHERPPHGRVLEVSELLAHPPRDVDPGHVVHGKDAHGHAETGQGPIHLLRRRPFLDQELRLIHVGNIMRLPTKPRQLATTTGTLPRRFASASAVARTSAPVCPPRTTSRRRMMFAGLKK